MATRHGPIPFSTVGGQSRSSLGQWRGTFLGGLPRRPAPPDRASLEGLANLLAAVGGTLHEWHRRSAQRRILAEIVVRDPYLLRDIGRTPTEVRAELDKWFWQA